MNYYHINSLEAYEAAYKQSIEAPETFWETLAHENFVWKKKWDNVLDWNFSTPEIKWFEGAQLNITENCIDRHLEMRGDKTAILFEPNNPNEPSEKITYNQLYKRVSKMANVLKNKGIQKGDRVCVYLPMIPELMITLLACARIGAIHSVVFAGFSSTALATRINDSDCKMIITSDGSYRGSKTIDLKGIVDTALKDCPCVDNVLVVKRTNSEVFMKSDRDYWLQPLLENASFTCVPEVMEAEDPLFILYTSGSTGNPKGMLHTTAGYMIQTAFSFINAFQYEENDIYWCTADIGWITGHSYAVYGPLANGATTVMFEGIPSYPDYGRFWQIIEKHKINQFYTAPTAIRTLMKQPIDLVKRHDLSSLKVLGTVGEPINEEAWNWYNNHIGNQKCPIIDSWWQTETGSIMICPIPGVTKTKATYTTLPFPGIQPVLMDEDGIEIRDNEASGHLCIKYPWPSMARTIWGNHQRYKDTYFSTFENKYFTGDGALRDNNSYYRITGRLDDVIIVSGHNLGTAPIEDAINEHVNVSESAIISLPHDVKGNTLYGFVTLKSEYNDQNVLQEEINQLITSHVGPIAKLDKIQITNELPKTRSGKIMRRILRKIVSDDTANLGDISTLVNPEVVQDIMESVS